jgi:hypothetical protein
MFISHHATYSIGCQGRRWEGGHREMEVGKCRERREGHIEIEEGKCRERKG